MSLPLDSIRNRTTVGFVALVLLAAAPLTPAAAAAAHIDDDQARAPRTATIAGRIVDATGGALPGATLVARPIAGAAGAGAAAGAADATTDRAASPTLSGSARGATAVTGSDGAFRLANLAPGAYRLTVRLTGFAEHTQDVTLTAGQTLDLDPPITLSALGGAETVDVIATMRDVSDAGTKMSTPIVETPQSVSVVTAEQMQQQAPHDIQEALRYAPGVRTEAYGFDARGDWALIRGGEPTLFLNGLRVYFGYYNIGRPEAFGVERIDVLRGPASVLYGQGAFNGVVNVVSKRPLATARREVSLQFGSFSRRQLGLDLTGPLDADGRWLYRLVALVRDSDTQVDFVPDDRLLIAPSLTWRPRASTTLTILTNVQKDDTGSSVGFFPWEGTLLPHAQGQVPTNRFISEPGFDAYDTRQASIGYQFEQKIDARWTLRQNFNYSRNRLAYHSIYTAFDPGPHFNDDGRTINRVGWVRDSIAHVPVVDTQVQGTVRTGALRHTVLAGLDFQHATITARSVYDTNVPPIDVLDPVYTGYTPPPQTPEPDDRQRQTGLYVQDQITYRERWIALVGVRRDWVTQEVGDDDAVDLAATTGRVGLVYRSRLGLAPYVSYSQAFDPIAGLDFYGQPFKPRRGKQVEGGVRYEPASKNGMVSVAVYDLREQNRQTNDPDNPLNTIQVGEARVRGVELDAGVKLASQINLTASYAYTDARVIRSNGTDQGKRLASTPANVFSLWATRPFDVGPVHGLTAGGGVRFTGASWDGEDSLKTPGVTLIDLMAAYDLERWRVSVNVANLTDQSFVSTCLARGDCFFGSRRTVTANLSRRF